MRTIAATLGVVFWAAAGLLLWFGLRADTSVEGVEFGQRVANMSLMHQQAIFVQLGIGAAIVGAIFLATLTIPVRIVWEDEDDAPRT